MTVKKNTCLIISIVLGSLILGIVIGFFIFKHNHESGDDHSSELRLGGTGLTNQLLECEVGEDTIGSLKRDFSPDLKKFIDDLKKEKNIANISVYYRDLNNGPVIEINQDESFAPASLLKVPVLISYLKWAEDKPGVLDEKIIFSSKVDVGYEQKFAPEVPIELGKTYTARELLETMTKYSDNQALILLFRRLPQSYQKELYTLLGVDQKLITDPTARLTIRQYSIFFRILFNASFLSRTNSEYALDLLTQTTFEEGIRASVPLDIPVAHKFGERKAPDGLQQFHDCGIVYYPNHPYLICVMTRGEKVVDLIDSIRDTSRFVYKIIDKEYKK